MAEEIVSSTPGSASSSGRKRGKGEAMGKATKNLEPGQKIDIRMNEYGQSCSKHTPQLSTWIGIQARNSKMFPLCYKSWKQVPEHCKHNAFKIIQEKFNIEDGSKKFILNELNSSWKDFKHHLKKEVYYKYSTDEERRAHLDKRVDIDQWNYLLREWNKEESKALAQRNKNNRKEQHMTKTTGKTPYACVREAERSKHPEGLYPSRYDLFKVTHTRKDGSASDPTSEKKMIEVENTLNAKPKEEQNDNSVKEAIFSSVVGEDNHGRMRMISFGQTPKDTHGTAAMRAAKLAQDNEQLCGKIRHLENELTQQKQTMEERLA